MNFSSRGLQFWDEMIASGALPSGKMNPRTGEYRLQRALCLARARDHQRAYEEVQLLRGDQQRLGHWAPQLVRICALCSTAAGTDTGLGKLYVDEAARILEQAALTPETAPPSATDRELNALKSFLILKPLWNTGNRIGMNNEQSLRMPSSSCRHPLLLMTSRIESKP
jgi:hypothetical protein